MRDTSILLRLTDEEKYAITEAAHEARMSAQEWIRETLAGATEGIGGNLPPAYAKKTPPPARTEHKATPQNLAAQFGIQTGDQILERPPWVSQDEPVAIVVARGRLFGTIPNRKLSQKEIAFNALAKLPFQKFSAEGNPTLDQHQNPIVIE
jgi:hypothetical protein